MSDYYEEHYWAGVLHHRSSPSGVWRIGGNSTTDYCTHGVPSFAPCRWCADGTEPQEPVRLSETERQERIDAIRAEWQLREKL